MRDRGAGESNRAREAVKRRARARRRQRANVAETNRALTTSPIGPPVRPSRADRRAGQQIEKVLHHATRTGRALTPAESRRAVGKYGFLAANVIEMGLRRIGQEQQAETLARSAPASRDIARGGRYVNRRNPVTMKIERVWEPPGRPLVERVAGFGRLNDATALGRAVNLVTSVPREAASMGIGLGQLAGRGGYDVAVDVKDLVSGGDPTFAHSRQTAEQLAKGVIADYRARYGSHAAESLQERGPLPYILDALGVGALATRGASVAAGAREARATGLSPLESIRQGYRKSVRPTDPRLAVPGAPRTLPLGTRDVPLSWSRSPMGRHFQQLYDDYSLMHPNRKIVGANRRASRRSVRLERQNERRVRVAAARDIAAIRHPAGRVGRARTAAGHRLFWEGNLPESLRGNEGLQAVRDHLVRMRDNPRRVRDLEPTANLVAARTKYLRLQDRLDKAVGANKAKIARQLDKAGADMRAAEDSVAVISRRNELLDQPGSIEKARKDLAAVSGTIEEALKGIEADLKARMGGKFTPEESMRRTKAKQEALGKKGKRAESRGRLEDTRTQAEELRDDAWQQLQRFAERDDEVGRTVKGWIDEHDRLQDLVSAHEERFLFKDAPEKAAAPAVEDIPANLGRGTYQGEARRVGGAASVQADELARLERRHLQRVGQSRAQLVKNLGELNQRINRAGRGTQTREALEQRAARLQETIDQADQVAAGYAYLRTEMLDRRVRELEQAMEHTPDEQYHAALAGAATLTADMERITARILGDEAPAIFTGRRSLLARMMGHDDLEPSDIFAPHRETRTGGRIRDTAGLGAPQGRRISGTSSTTNLGLRRKNRGVLVESGRVDPSLDHLIVQWGKAQSWRFVQNIRDLMYDAGDEIAVGTAPRPGWYVVDRKSRANPALWDNAELGDDGALVQGLEEFVADSVWKEGERTPDSYQDMRQVDPAIVESIFYEAGVDLPSKRLLGRSTAFGGAFDIVNGLVRTSLLYANPGYYPANFIGNLVFMGLHQHGFALPNLLRSGRMYFQNRPLFDRVSGEVGMGPTEALSAKTSTTGGMIDTALNAERRLTHVAASIPDNWPRVAAWEFEARSHGFKTAEQQMELLTATDQESMAVRQTISDRAVEAMVNFERTSPLERAVLGRVFFVWPWIRGATAWAAHYMVEYPERAAVIAPVAAEEHRQDVEPYKAGLPAYLENLIPLNKLGTHVLNVGSVSPSATAAQLVQTFAGTINSAVNDVPPPKYNGLGDMINPLLDFAWNTIHSQTSFGEEVGLRTALLRNATELSPLTSTILQATGRQPVSKIYTDDSARAVLERRWGRVFPFDVNKQAIAERAKIDEPGPSQTPQSRMDDWIQETTSLLGEPNEAIRRARRNQMLFEEAAGQFKEKKYGSSRHKISEREEAAVLLSVDASQFAGRWDPSVLTQRQNDIRTGPPAFIRRFIRDERNLLWEQLLDKVNQQRADEKRRRQDKAYAASHG